MISRISSPSCTQPPRLAAWLVGLFTSDQEAESIPGDLQEEFSQLAAKCGVAVARRWYRRQVIKTVAHLGGRAFSGAPWATTAAVVGGLFLSRFVQGLPDKLLSAVTDRYLFYWSNHFKAYMFWATDGMMIAHITASLLVGCVVALAARGREMVATMTLGFVHCMMSVVAFLVLVSRTGDDSFLWILVLQLADALAIVMGGVIVRTRRSAAKRSAITAVSSSAS